MRTTWLKSLSVVVTMAITSAGAWAVEIPTDNERINNSSRYEALPGFPKDSIEFVHDSVEDIELMQRYLQPTTIQFIKDQGLQWLQVRDVRIDKLGIINVADGVLIPIVAGIRYMRIRNWIDGTVNVLLHVTASQGNIHVEFIDYNDNRFWQAIGRWVWWIDFNKFSNDVAGDTLRSFLNQPGATDELLSLRP